MLIGSVWIFFVTTGWCYNLTSVSDPQANRDRAPVLLWLQGGPGGTSMFGLFVEHGPYVVHKNLTGEDRLALKHMLSRCSALVKPFFSPLQSV